MHVEQLRLLRSLGQFVHLEPRRRHATLHVERPETCLVEREVQAAVQYGLPRIIPVTALVCVHARMTVVPVGLQDRVGMKFGLGESPCVPSPTSCGVCVAHVRFPRMSRLQTGIAKGDAQRIAVVVQVDAVVDVGQHRGMPEIGIDILPPPFPPDVHVDVSVEERPRAVHARVRGCLPESLLLVAYI